jgi:hypothetical protein
MPSNEVDYKRRVQNMWAFFICCVSFLFVFYEHISLIQFTNCLSNWELQVLKEMIDVLSKKQPIEWYFKLFLTAHLDR